MKNYIIAVTIVVALLLVFAGCGQKQEKADLRKVRVVLDWTPNTNHAGVYVARDLGFYKEQGLDVEIIQPGENTAEKIVALGQAEFGFSYQESVTIARSQGVQVKSLAAVIQHNSSGFASLKEADVASPKDFSGKRYGSSGWPSELGILKQVMESSKADFDSVEVVHGIADFFTTIGKNADFEWIYYGWDGVQARLKGIDINFIPVRDIDPIFDFYTPVLIASDLMVNSEPELMKKFLAATSRGYELCIKDPARGAEVFSKAVPELDRELVKASLDHLSGEFQADAPRWGQQNPVVWKNFADWMLRKGIITTGVEALAAFTNEFLPDAADPQGQ